MTRDVVPRSRLGNAVKPEEPWRWHGTVGGYTNHGCRCPDCTRAMTAARLDHMRRTSVAGGYVVETHGVSAYNNHGCRCSECRAAWAEYQRSRRARRIVGS